MDRIRPKGGTEAEWIALDPILMERELALTLNEDNIPTGLKAGDGVSHWSALSYLTGNGNSAQINSDWNAISGKAEILNKPTIPNAQTQSDWNQGNASSVDFIKNKPTIPAAQIQPDWNAISGMGSILNKPTIPSDFEKSYLSLTDTPDSYAGKAKNIPIVTDAENGMDFMGTVLAKLTYLADFPAAYTGQSLKLVRVKADESGVEFVANNFLTAITKSDVEAVLTGAISTHTHNYQAPLTTSDLFLDTVNHRVGVGTSTPLYKFEVKGSLATDSIRTWTGLDFYFVVAPTGLTGTPTIGGSVTAGTHYYFVTYTTAIGETNCGNIIAVTTDAVNNAVDLVIPVSADARVTGRRIYRTKAGMTSDNEYFLATIADNTTTTYKDIIADGSLTGISLQRYRINATGLGITKDGSKALFLDENLTAFGLNAGKLLGQSGYAPVRTTLFGHGAGQNLTTGQANHIFGFAGASLTTGGSNTLFGDLACYILTTGNNNNAFGSQCGRYLTIGTGNNFYGTSAGNKITSGLYNTCVGYATNGVNNGVNSNYSNSFGAFSYNTKNNQTVIGTDASLGPTYETTETIINGDNFIKRETSLGSEILTNGALTGGASWAAASDCILTSDKATWTYSSGTASTLTQLQANLAISLKSYRWYKFSYTISGITGTPTATITTASSLAVTNLPIVAGTLTIYFQSAATPTNFVITSTLIAGQSFTLDSFSLKEVIGGDLFVNRNLGIGINSATAALDINSDIIRLRTSKTPSSATDIGNAGDICADDNYIYKCIAANTWRRSPLTTW